jgi:hypothetical protein
MCGHPQVGRGPGYRVSYARLSLGMVQMGDPASKVIERVLNFVGIPLWEEVAVSWVVRAKSAEGGLQFGWASTVAFWVRDLELVF